MIYCADVLYDEMVDEITTVHEDIYVAPYNLRVPPTIPTVWFEEVTNTTYTMSSDSGDDENHIRVGYEFNIFTMGDNKKADAIAIAKTIDSAMKSRGFRRGYSGVISFLEDETLYRYVVRYSGIVDKDLKVRRG